MRDAQVLADRRRIADDDDVLRRGGRVVVGIDLDDRGTGRSGRIVFRIGLAAFARRPCVSAAGRLPRPPASSRPPRPECGTAARAARSRRRWRPGRARRARCRASAASNGQPAPRPACASSGSARAVARSRSVAASWFTLAARILRQRGRIRKLPEPRRFRQRLKNAIGGPAPFRTAGNLTGSARPCPGWAGRPDRSSGRAAARRHRRAARRPSDPAARRRPSPSPRRPPRRP